MIQSKYLFNHKQPLSSCLGEAIPQYLPLPSPSPASQVEIYVPICAVDTRVAWNDSAQKLHLSISSLAVPIKKWVAEYQWIQVGVNLWTNSQHSKWEFEETVNSNIIYTYKNKRGKGGKEEKK